MNSQNMMNGAPMMEQQTKSKSNILIPVLAILGVHVILLGALLLQGCKDKPSANVADNSIVTNLPTITFSNPPVIDATATIQPPPQPVVSAPPIVSPPVPAAAQPIQPAASANSTLMPPPVGQASTTTTTLPVAGGVTEHKIEAGETFATIAKKYGVSVDAIIKANPNVNPRRLQIGQIIKVPEHSEATVTKTATSVASTTGSEKSQGSATATKTAAVSNSDAKIYVVKPGDNLTKISKAYGVSVRDLKAANNLTSERINVGQKLKIPVKNQSPSSPTPKAPAGDTMIDNSLPKPPPANV